MEKVNRIAREIDYPFTEHVEVIVPSGHPLRHFDKLKER